jgi:hypothetical protein
VPAADEHETIRAGALDNGLESRDITDNHLGREIDKPGWSAENIVQVWLKGAEVNTVRAPFKEIEAEATRALTESVTVWPASKEHVQHARRATSGFEFSDDRIWVAALERASRACHFTPCERADQILVDVLRGSFGSIAADGREFCQNLPLSSLTLAKRT